MNEDVQHLRLLSIFHYVVGGIAALFACIPIIHLIAGIAFVVASSRGGGGSEDVPPAFIGWIFIFVALGAILFGWAFAVCVIAAGRFLARRVRYMFCLVMGGIECVFMPFGTVLGVFTIIVLMRPSVKELFGRGAGQTQPEEALDSAEG